MKLRKNRYDVFISYRRDGGEETAKHLRDALTERGYKVFLDVESLRNGPFNEALYQVIDESKDFLLILPKNALDRCVNENDWVRKEIEYARQSGKNIIPIMLKGFVFPDELPESIDFIRYQNAPPSFEISFFDAFVDKLQTFMVSKRKQRWKRLLVLGIAAVLLIALGFGIYHLNTTYPLTSKDKNLVSDLIAYLNTNLTQVDIAGERYVKELDRSLQFVEEKTTDTAETLQFELNNYCETLSDCRAALTDLPDQLRQDLMNNSHFNLGEIDAFKPTLSSTINNYINRLQYIRNTVIANNSIRSETHIYYLNMQKEMAQLDAEILFYNVNGLLLSITNESALDDLKNRYLPAMSFIYAKRLDLTTDKEALTGKIDAAFLQYEKLLTDYGDVLQREKDAGDTDEIIQSYDFLIAYRERRGMDASDLIAQREKTLELIRRIEEEKQATVELSKNLEKTKEEAYEKYKPLEEDDIDHLWGKGKIFLYIKMPEAAAECYRLFIGKTEGADQLVGKTALRFTEVCTALDIWGGVVVHSFEEGAPKQAVEAGDIIYEVDGTAVKNNPEYREAVSQPGVHAVKIIRFTSNSYELLDGVIDTELGSITAISLLLEDDAISN